MVIRGSATLIVDVNTSSESEAFDLIVKQYPDSAGWSYVLMYEHSRNKKSP